MATTLGYPNVCDLECTDKNKSYGNRHEFVGPVKIILVETTPIDYKRKVWGSAIFTFVMLLMGATVFTVFFFTLKFKLPFAMNVHVLLCTMGFQLFMTTGIMMFSTLFGGSMHLKPSDRKFQHFFLEISAVLIGTIGTAFSFEYMAFTVHAVAGIFSTLFSILSCLVGPTVYPQNESEKLFGAFNKRAHRYISVFTFILCSVCFCLGIVKPGFTKWAPVNHLGLLATALSFVAVLMGPGAYWTNSQTCFGKFTHSLHIMCALPAFLTCNISFILGLIKESFREWTVFPNLYVFLIILTVLYSAAAMASLRLRAKYDL